MPAQRPGLVKRLRTNIANWLSPAARTHSVRAFQAARMDRLTANWLSVNQSINEELRGDLDKLRVRGRELCKNNDYAKKFVGLCQNNIVGPNGFKLQSRVQDGPGKPDKLANQAIEAAFSEWSKKADITGTMSLTDICDTLIGSMPSDGEFLVRFVRGAEAGNRFNFAVQLIDVDRIDTTYNTAAVGSGNRVIMGIEQDQYGRPLAAYIFAGHPNDGQRTDRTRIRVPMDEILHRYRIETPGQARGIPWMSPGMLSLHHLGGFKLAALLAAEHGANHFGFFVTPDGEIPLGVDKSDQTQQITTSQPGVFDTLPTGVDFKPFESKYPETNFHPFVKVTLQRIAAGWRVSYHSLANDLEGVNFSSIRSGTIEERERWKSDQEWFINAFLEPLYAEWIKMALLSGAITFYNGSALPASKLAKFSAHEWQGRRWDWVDPLKDMNAKVLSVKAGLVAPQDLAAEMGYDFDDVLSKIKVAHELAANYGVTLTAYESMPSATPAAAADIATSEDPATKQLQALERSISELSQRWDKPDSASQLENLALAFTAIAARMPAPTVTVHTPEQRHEHHHHVQAPSVEVKNDVHVPETTVHVEAVMPSVRAAAPVVNVVNQVQPAEVTVVDSHPTTAVQTVERDANDEITRTVTRYTKD